MSAAPAFAPGSAATATATVELAVSCRNLLDMDVFSKSDPMCVLFLQAFGSDHWYEFGRTEIIWNNLNPDFVKRFVIDYLFEERQMLRFEVYDIDSTSFDLRRHDFLGKMECSLGEIVSSSKIERGLIGPKPNSGKIIVVAEEESGCKEEATMHFCATHLDRKDCCGSSDPFLAIYRVNSDGAHTLTHRTEVIRNNLNPTWAPFTLTVNKLCFGHYDQYNNTPILIKCVDWNRNGDENLIGQVWTSMKEVSEHLEGHNWTLRNPKFATKKGYKGSGELILIKAAVVKISSFMDYIQAGTQLACTIAIDFTSSNGPPDKPHSLHYIYGNAPSEYASALRAVGDIIQDYDSDKLFPVLGFGARLPPHGIESHEFFVNMDQHNPFCEGVDGVLDAYYKCIPQIQLFGPTYFAPVIEHVTRFAAAKQDGSEYFILLIITDGIISDMENTKRAIVNAAVLPLSIIIVGVGGADFTAMNILDGDEVRLSYQGRLAQRDIVQFVPFREVIGYDWARNIQLSQAKLAKEVLAEIPHQFLSYMKFNNISPGSWKKNQ